MFLNISRRAPALSNAAAIFQPDGFGDGDLDMVVCAEFHSVRTPNGERSASKF